MGFQVGTYPRAIGDESSSASGQRAIRNKRTLIVLHALRVMDRNDPRRTKLTRALGNEKATQEEIKDAIDVLHDCGAIEHARKTAQDYAAKAEEQLECLPPSAERDFLSGLIGFAVGRKV